MTLHTCDAAGGVLIVEIMRVNSALDSLIRLGNTARPSRSSPRASMMECSCWEQSLAYLIAADARKRRWTEARFRGLEV
jgi:hypothetical protein